MRRLRRVRVNGGGGFAPDVLVAAAVLEELETSDFDAVEFVL